MHANTRHLRTVAVSALCIAAGAALAGTVTFPAAFPFAPGTPIRASEVNDTFNAVKSAVDDNAAAIAGAHDAVTALAARVAALEAAAAGRQSFHAAQAVVDANASTDDTWVDVPGVAIPVTLAQDADVRFQLFARVYNFGATPGAITSCSVRIVQDDAGTPLLGSSPAIMGNWNAYLVGGDSSAGNSESVALGGLVRLPAGAYDFKAQVARRASPGNSGSCSIFRWNFSRAQLFVDVVP